MKKHLQETDRAQIAAAISAWENEGGALGRVSMNQYGRRIEADRSWTIYHVFTGVPARFGGDAMTGLSRLDATRGMLRLNLNEDALRPLVRNPTGGTAARPVMEETQRQIDNDTSGKRRRAKETKARHEMY